MQTTTDPAQLFGCDVLDSAGNKIGSVDGVWVDDATNELEFIAVKTGGLFAKDHLMPVTDAQIGDGAITVPYSEDQINGAPSFDTDAELTPEQEDEIYGYYGVDRSTAASPTGLPSGTTNPDLSTAANDTAATGTTTGMAVQEDQAGVTLSEEELQVGKRQVEAGRVRLRKVVRTEQQEVPVELRREDVEIERVPASEADAPADAFQEAEIEVPIMREEPVVAKEAHVTGGVRVAKTADTETRTVGGEVRKEDVEVENDADTLETDERQY